jgi:hypothetical protein
MLMFRAILVFCLSLFAALLLSHSAQERTRSRGRAVLPSGCDPGAGSVPAPAAAVGFTCRTFYDGFRSRSTIDTTNSLVPGFRWYLGNNWPRSVNGNWPGSTITPTPASWYSIGSGGLSLTPLADDSRGQIALMTCGPTPAPPYWVGNAFTGGFFLRTVQSARGSSGANAWPLIWTWPIEMLAGTTTGTVTWVENDHLEGGGGSVGPTMNRYFHYWRAVNGVNTINNSVSAALTIPSSGVTADTLVVPAALNGGTSKMDWFVNGTVEHVSVPDSNTDAFDVFVSNHSCILLGAGYGSTMVFRSIEIWQKPP